MLEESYSLACSLCASAHSIYFAVVYPVLGAWQRVKIILCAGYDTLSFPMAEGTTESTREANTRTQVLLNTFQQHSHLTSIVL